MSTFLSNFKEITYAQCSLLPSSLVQLSKPFVSSLKSLDLPICVFLRVFISVFHVWLTFFGSWVSSLSACVLAALDFGD